jgi:hypothetical protein
MIFEIIYLDPEAAAATSATTAATGAEGGADDHLG